MYNTHKSDYYGLTRDGTSQKRVKSYIIIDFASIRIARNIYIYKGSLSDILIRFFFRLG